MVRTTAKLFILLIILMLAFEFVLHTLMSDTAAYKSGIAQRLPERSKEELYQDIFISLLMPYIELEIDKYYSKYLTETLDAAPYMIYVLNAERPRGYRTFFFKIKLRVDSYIGLHISVGLDYITVTVTAAGDVKIEKFQHIKSYMLPPNYAAIIREGYNNPIP